VVRRIVTKLPLAELWSDTGPVAARRVRCLTAQDIRDFLRAGPVRFVIANIGEPLRWVPTAECFQFWKVEVRPRLAEADHIRLEDFPDGYCYGASEWMPIEGPPIVLLEVFH